MCNLRFCLKNLEKQEQNKLRRNKWKEIIVIKAEINEIKSKNRESEIKSFFENNKTNEPLARLRVNTNYQYQE